MKRSVAVYVMAIVATTLLATIAIFILTPRPESADWLAAVLFSVLGFISVLLSYQRSGGTTSGSVSFLPLLSGIVVAPTPAVILTAFFAELSANFLQKKTPIKALFNAAQIAASTTVAVAILQSQGRLTIEGFDLTRGVHFVIASLAFFATNALLVVGALTLSERRAYWATLKRIVTGTFVYDVMALPVIALLALSYTKSGWWVVAVVLPLLGLRQLYKQNAELEKFTQELLHFMVAVTEARDVYTSGHSRRVAAYSQIIAKGARLPARVVARIGIAALLHDVGKIYEVFGPILRSPGRLTPEQFAIIQTHPAKGAELVSKVSQLQDVVPIIQAHHERWDGRGYPDRIVGASIPLGARVIALADTIDAMNTSRPYRDALTTQKIRTEIETGRGTQFDPQLVDSLLTSGAWEKLQAEIIRFERGAPDEGAVSAEIDEEISLMVGPTPKP